MPMWMIQGLITNYNPNADVDDSGFENEWIILFPLHPKRASELNNCGQNLKKSEMNSKIL